MRQNILERTGECISQSADRAARATSAVIDAAEDGVDLAKRAVRQSRDTADDILDGAARRIQRHPLQTAVATFAVALGAGVLIGSLLKRR